MPVGSRHAEGGEILQVQDNGISGFHQGEISALVATTWEL